MLCKENGCLMFSVYVTKFKISLYSRTPEIETADFSQSYASLNLSQFQAYCLFHRNSSTATKNNCNMHLMLEINYKDP